MGSTSADEDRIAYEKVEQKYHDDQEVSVYDRKRFGAPGGRFLNQRQVATVLELIGATPGSLLEAGCGTGRFTFELARAGHQVTAVDYSAAMLESCRARQPSEAGGSQVTFREASIFELPFDDDSFDAVISIHVLMHLPDYERALTELLRVLRPGGRLVFDIRNSHSLNRLAYPLRRLGQRLRGRKPWRVWYCSRAGIGELAAAHGARVTEIRGMFPIKPNRLPEVLMPVVRGLESVGEESAIRRLGHIQMVALTKG